MSAIEVLPSFTGYEVGDIYAEAAELSGETLIRNRTPKALGELAEIAFSYKAATLGFGLSKPMGDNEPFDFVLNSGHRLWRVQVKSTYHLGKSDGYSLRAVRAALGGRSRTYTANDIDVLAGWIMPLDVWYIIPVQAFAPRKTIAVYPHRENHTGQFEPFREAWCLLTCSEQRTPNSRVQIDRCQMNENLMRPSGPGSPCPLKELLSQLESKAPGKRLRLPRRM